MKILLLTFVFLAIRGDLPNLKNYFNSAINDEAVKAIKNAGAKWEVYAPNENPLRIYNDQQLKYLTSMPGVDYDAYMQEMLSLGDRLHQSIPKAKSGNPAASSLNEPVKAFSFPTSFDWRDTDTGKRCQLEIQNQGACGACYSFATSSCLTARTCAAVPGASPVELSHQNILACNKRTNACAGGLLDAAFNYAEDYGVVSKACMPYAESNTPDSQNYPSQKCPATCTGTGSYNRTFCKKGTSLLLYGIDRIKNEIYQRGPVASSMIVWSDLTNYRSGVYKQTSGTKQGGHAILLIGWGVEDTTNYLIVQNSWGPDWGLNGVFKIDQNDANSAIGTIGYYCIPDV